MASLFGCPRAPIRGRSPRFREKVSRYRGPHVVLALSRRVNKTQWSVFWDFSLATHRVRDLSSWPPARKGDPPPSPQRRGQPPPLLPPPSRVDDMMTVKSYSNVAMGREVATRRDKSYLDMAVWRKVEAFEPGLVSYSAKSITFS